MMKKLQSLLKHSGLLLALFSTHSLFAEAPSSTEPTVFLAAEPLTQDHILDLQTVIYHSMVNPAFRKEVLQSSRDRTWAAYISLHAKQMDEYDLSKSLCEGLGGGLTRSETQTFAEQARKDDPSISIHALQSRAIQSLDLDSLVGTTLQERYQIKGMWWLHKNMPTRYIAPSVNQKISEMNKKNLKKEASKTEGTAAR